MAYPRILQRLFANNGAGPLLRADILPAQNVAIDNLFIGAPIYQPTTTLPANCMWPDGSLALFIDWPEFAAKYRAGGFAGMVDNSSNSANLGKFILNSNGTGLYLPRCGGQFMRNWTPGQSVDTGRQAGSWQGDMFKSHTHGSPKVAGNDIPSGGWGISPNPSYIVINLRADGGSETRPSNISQPIVICMGGHA